jgi:hypothetical protein
MPNNSIAKRDKKRKDKKKKTVPPPLHKEDKTSADSSTLSLSLAGSSIGVTTSSANAKNKDSSLPLLHLGTIKSTAPLSMGAEPKSDASVVEWENSKSLSAEERAILYAETRSANPDTSAKDFALAY